MPRAAPEGEREKEARWRGLRPLRRAHHVLIDTLMAKVEALEARVAGLKGQISAERT